MKPKKCPVCDWEIADEGIDVQAGGQHLTVCCEDCAQKAKDGPTKYAAPAE